MSKRDVIARAILDLNPSAAHWEDQYPSVQQRKQEEADAILSTITAAGYVVEQGWRDISTAPRDGTAVLLIARYPDGVTWSDQYHSWWHDTARKSRVVTQDGHWARWPHPFPPSHWRPLPAPPAVEATP